MLSQTIAQLATRSASDGGSSASQSERVGLRPKISGTCIVRGKPRLLWFSLSNLHRALTDARKRIILVDSSNAKRLLSSYRIFSWSCDDITTYSPSPRVTNLIYAYFARVSPSRLPTSTTGSRPTI